MNPDIKVTILMLRSVFKIEKQMFLSLGRCFFVIVLDERKKNRFKLSPFNLELLFNYFTKTRKVTLSGIFYTLYAIKNEVKI